MKFRAGSDLPAAGDLAQLQAAVALVIVSHQHRNRRLNEVAIYFDDVGDHLCAYRLISNEDQCLGN